MSNAIRFCDRWVGDGHPCFVIAELGVNHNGSMELAKKLIDAAVFAGADACKFQTFKTEKVVSSTAPKADYQKINTKDESGSQQDMIKALELGPEDFKELAMYAKAKGITFFSTPFDLDSVDVLESIGVGGYKNGSGEITNAFLLRKVASTGKPLILSTGMCSVDEICQAVELVKRSGASSIALMHCVSSYPAPPESMNLRAMSTISRAFGGQIPVGFSDHSLGIEASVFAVAMGATCIEKHMTLSKNMEGPDHAASLEPEEFREMVQAIRRAEVMRGSDEKKCLDIERNVRDVARRSLFLTCDCRAGDVITYDNIEALRPGIGINPMKVDEVVGAILKRDIPSGTMLSMDDLLMQSKSAL